MIQIHIQLYSIYREKIPADRRGKITLEMKAGQTLDDLLQELEIDQKAVVSVNGVQISEPNHRLEDKDQVKIFSSAGGG